MTDRLETVRALIAKAEGTEFPEEAKAFLAKAGELMARYEIDDSMLRAAAPVRDEKPTHKTIVIPKPYAAAKTDLFSAVARHHGCRLVLSGGVRGKSGQTVHVFGFANSIGNAEMMFAALELESVRELQAAVIAGYGIGEHGKSFTNSFLSGFAVEINARLQEARRRAQTQGQEAYGQSMALAVRDDKAAVDSLVSATFGRLGKASSRSVASNSGYGAGRAAGSRASLGNAVGNNSRNSLTA